MKMKIFYKVFLSFIMFVLLTLLAFWMFYYRDVMSSTKEKIINSISTDVENVKRNVNQYLTLREAELHAISNMPAVKLFIMQREFVKIKARRNVEDVLIDFAKTNSAIERLRIVESNYFEKEPTVIELKEKKAEFDKQNFIETVKIERDEVLNDRFEARYNYKTEENGKFISDLIQSNGILYAITYSDNREFLSIGKVIRIAITGEIRGVVIADLSISQIQSFIDKSSGKDITKITFKTNDDGVSSVEKNGNQLINNIDYIRNVSDLDFNLLKDAESLSYSIPIGNGEMSLDVEMESREAQYLWYKTKSFLFLFLIGFSIISVFISYLLSKSISTPIRQLNEEVGKIDETNLHKMHSNTNVTEIRQLTATFNTFIDRLRSYKEELERSAHLAVIGQSAAIIAHDLRSPLSVISGFIAKHAPDFKNTNYFEAAMTSIEKLNKLTDDLLAFSVATDISRVSVDVVEIIKTVFKEVQAVDHVKMNNVFLNYSGAENLIATIDPDKLNRVLINLITNSVHSFHDENGGVIDVGASVADNSTLVLKVADNGCGIKVDFLPRIFDVFFTKSKVKGTGLGLSYCKQVVEVHGGKITVDSMSGVGTSFTIILPNCVSSGQVKRSDAVLCADSKNDKVNRPSMQDLKNGIFLVVDDEECVLTQWESILSDNGHKIIKASSGKELLSSDIDYSKIDCAIVDYEFKGSNITGFEIIEYLKTKNVHNIHICTGYWNDPKICLRAKELDVVSIIPKPIPNDLNKLFKIKGE